MSFLDQDFVNKAVEDIKDLIHENIENGFEGWKPDANDLCFQLAFMRDEYRDAVYDALSNKEKQFVSNISAEIEEAREGKWSLDNLSTVLRSNQFGDYFYDEYQDDVYISPLEEEDEKIIHLSDELSVKDMKSLAFDASIESPCSKEGSLHIIDKAGKEYKIWLESMSGTVKREGLSVRYTRSYGLDKFDFHRGEDYFTTKAFESHFNKNDVLQEAEEIAQILDEDQFDAKALHCAIDEHYSAVEDVYRLTGLPSTPVSTISDNYEAFKALFKIQDEIANQKQQSNTTQGGPSGRLFVYSHPDICTTQKLTYRRLTKKYYSDIFTTVQTNKKMSLHRVRK